MSLADKIAALPKPPIATPDEIFERCTQYALMRLPGQPFGIHMGTSYLISDLQMSLRAALARLTLAREWIDNCHHEHGCPWQHTSHRSDLMGLNPPCTCGRDAMIAVLEPPK